MCYWDIVLRVSDWTLKKSNVITEISKNDWWKKKNCAVFWDTLCCENSEDNVSKNQSHRSEHSGGDAAIYYQHHNLLSISIHVRRTIACVYLSWLSSLGVLREISTAYMSNTLPVMLIHRRFLAPLDRHRIFCNTRDSLAQFQDKRDRKLI